MPQKSCLLAMCLGILFFQSLNTQADCLPAYRTKITALKQKCSTGCWEPLFWDGNHSKIEQYKMARNLIKEAQKGQGATLEGLLRGLPVGLDLNLSGLSKLILDSNNENIFCSSEETLYTYDQIVGSILAEALQKKVEAAK